PVLLDMPIDVLTTSLDEESVRIPQTARISGRAGPDAPSVAAALDLLRGAERPILLVGSGAWQSGCAAELRELAELAHMPVFSDFQAHGLLPSDHALYGGTFHKLADLSAAQERPDVVLALGTRFGLFTLGASDKLVPAAARIIHVEVDPREIGRLREAAVAIHADPR